MKSKKIEGIIEKLKEKFNNLSVKTEYDSSDNSYIIYVNDLSTYLDDSFQDYITDVLTEEFANNRMPDFSFLYSDSIFEAEEVELIARNMFISYNCEDSYYIAILDSITSEHLNFKNTSKKIEIKSILDASHEIILKASNIVQATSNDIKLEKRLLSNTKHIEVQNDYLWSYLNASSVPISITQPNKVSNLLI